MKRISIAKCFCALTIVLLLASLFFSTFNFHLSSKSSSNNTEYFSSLKDKNSTLLFSENNEIEIDNDEIDEDKTYSFIVSNSYNIRISNNIRISKIKNQLISTKKTTSNQLPIWLEMNKILI